MIQHGKIASLDTDGNIFWGCRGGCAKKNGLCRILVCLDEANRKDSGLIEKT
jgi:hypothetical protein